MNNITGGANSYFYVRGNANNESGKYGVPAGTYYVKVQKDNNYSASDYSVKVNFTAATDWETENNNTKETADVVQVNQKINGNISVSGDVDWYKFTTNSTNEIALRFSHEVIDSTRTYWDIYLYDNSGSTKLSLSRRGDTEIVISDYVKITSGTYYVKVAQDNYSGVDYSLTVLTKHDHKGTWEITTAPTCTNGGIESRTCTICKSVERREIDALGHSYDSGIVTKKATITAKGVIEYKCNICGKTFIEDDKHLIWALPAICSGVILLIFGVINYFIILKMAR